MVDISAYSKVHSIDLDIFCLLTQWRTPQLTGVRHQRWKCPNFLQPVPMFDEECNFCARWRKWGLLSCSAHTVTADKDPRALFGTGKDLKNCTPQPSISFASVDFQPESYWIQFSHSDSLKKLAKTWYSVSGIEWLHGTDISRVWSTVVAAWKLSQCVTSRNDKQGL